MSQSSILQVEDELHRQSIEAAVMVAKGLQKANECNDRGETILHLAVLHKCPEAISGFLELGCNPNLGNIESNATPLHYAIAYDDRNSLVALLKGGADPNLVDIYGNPPLAHAVIKMRPDRPDLVGPLLEAEARVDLQNKSGRSVAMHLRSVKSEFILAPFRERGLY